MKQVGTFFRAQSFTLLKADLHQKLTELFHSSDSLMEHSLEVRTLFKAIG